MKVLKKEKMMNHTSFKIGGVADVIAIPESMKELQLLIEFLRKEYIKYYIIGRGTNLLVSDDGIRGCVVKISSALSKIKVTNQRMEIEAGALMVQVADAALNNSLVGFEPLSGIPGTIGGAIAMNAGAYGKSISDFVLACDVLDENGKILTLSRRELDFSYRHSIIEEKGYIVLKVYLEFEKGDEEVISKNMNQYRDLRKANQPLEYPSAGSIFKKPEGTHASILIEESNLKGESVGDAEVSTKHSGFIINKGKAKAQEVYKLINKIKDKIKTYYNINLELEIKLLGKFSNK